MSIVFRRSTTEQLSLPTKITIVAGSFNVFDWTYTWDKRIQASWHTDVHYEENPKVIMTEEGHGVPKDAIAARHRQVLEEAIEAHSTALYNLGQFLWENPEVAFEEVKAHDYITHFLESEGFYVERRYCLPTAFRAEYGAREGPVVFFLCEYDAVPEMGHACGHNLIAESAVGAGLALKRLLETDKAVNGKVVVLGTPAEENSHGKELLLRYEAFKDADVVLTTHPANKNVLRIGFSAQCMISVKFQGKAAHAALSPWEGVNALDAAVGSYVNVSMLRQQLKSTWRVHGIFVKAGGFSSIIPEESELTYTVRAPTGLELTILRKKVEDCFTSAAGATGCAVNVDNGTECLNVVHNEPMVLSFQKNAESYGFEFMDSDHAVHVESGASTDVGNVSHVVPCIRPAYKIDTQSYIHSREFQQAAGTPEAHQVALRVAKALALTALDVMQDADLLRSIKQELYDQVPMNHDP